MANSQLTAVFRQIRRAIGLAGTEELPDGQLLERFVAQQDEVAFEQLIQRYGPMVLGVCRRILVDANDADDAFQATFLVLVRRAATLDQRAPLGNWLYGVALRTALKARAAARRRERQRQTTTMSPDDPTADLAWHEVRTVLDEELQRLPEKYRAPLILCYLAGKTNQEAARELGCPLGSMGWRLDRARNLLRDRLVRRGIVVPSVALAGLLAEQTQAAVPASLAAGALRNAVLLAAAQAVPAAQAHVFQLAEGVLRTMFVKKLVRIAGVTCLLIGLVGAAVAAAGLQLLAAPKEAKANLPPVIRSAGSGVWSAPATWEGSRVPGAGARVLIRTGHRVVYDGRTERPVRAINVSGTLAFAPDKDTRLDVGLIKIQPGDEYSEEGFDCEADVMAPDADKPGPALEVGTPNRPIDAGRKALIRLAFIEGMDKQSCPAIVCCGGRMDLHGTPMSRTWVKLGATANKGDNAVSLAEAVTGWKAGDRIIVTATGKTSYGKSVGTEERTIQTIEGTKLTLDRPLENEHLGEGLYRGEIANLSRNVVVESADPQGERGHTMYHRYSSGSISYAEFRHLGKEGVLGRYSLHYHRVGDTMRGSYVLGASIWDSGNRWLTIHGTNYLVARDNVGYGSVGHGFFMEDGTEVYNVLDRNLAVGARRGKPLPKQVLRFDPNNGAGYWWANSLNTFTRNVAVENGEYGFRYEATASKSFPLVRAIQQPDGSKKDIDIRTLPFVRFEDNEVHSGTGHYAVNLGEGVNRVGPDSRHPFIVRNLLVWNSHYGFRPQVPSLLVENMRLHGTVYGVYHPNYDNHVYRNITINGDGSEPFNRGHDDLSVQYGVVTVDGLTFENVRGSNYSIPLIQMTDNNPTGKAVMHFRNVKVLRADPKNRRPLANTGGGARVKPETSQGVPVYLHDYYGPNRHAKVEMTNAKDFGTDGLKYREEQPLTGAESRVTEVANVPFPQLLDPVDDLPPTTVITHVRRLDGGKVQVRGTTADNGTVAKVLVNGKEARAVSPNFAQWEIVLAGVPAGQLKVQGHAADAAGNVEKRPHAVVLR